MAKSPIKWAGGKARLLHVIMKHVPKEFNRYYEPFVGGGALFFALQHQNSVLSDSNGELMNMFTQIRDNLSELIETLSKYPISNESFYYEMRALVPVELSPLIRACRFLYLNKTCFNGLYRTNRSGQMNTPWGKAKAPNVCDKGTLKVCSKALQGVALDASYFQKSLMSRNAEEGDFIYLDPPYVPISDTSFVGYSKKGFSMEDHELLASIFEEKAGKGVQMMLSNADVPWVRERYKEFKLIEVQAPRSINSKGSGRGKVGELLIKSY